MKYSELPLSLSAIGINAVPVPFSYSASGAPHAEAARASYTVPPVKRAMVLGGELSAVRDAAPTASGAVTLSLDLTARNEATVRLLEKSFVLPSVADSKDIGLSAAIPLYPGDVLTVNSADVSTGGTVIINEGLIILEFEL